TMQVISGTLLLKDGSPCTVRPFVKLTYTPGEGQRPEVFKIYEGETKEVKGVRVGVGNVQAGTVLSYRHDPGVPLLWIAVPVLFFGMLFRAWGRWLRVSYVVEKVAGPPPSAGSRVYVQLQRAGIWGGEAGMMEKLGQAITRE
ncbi:MAG: hypothetical protein AAB260_01035, partial [Planctomycetota bacterium]